MVSQGQLRQWLDEVGMIGASTSCSLAHLLPETGVGTCAMSYTMAVCERSWSGIEPLSFGPQAALLEDVEVR